VDFDDVIDDGESEADAAGVACACIIEPCEAFKHADPVGYGDSGSVVGDNDFRLPTNCPHRDRDPGRGVAGRIVEKVPNRSGQERGVADHLAGVDVSGVDDAVDDHVHGALEREVLPRGAAGAAVAHRRHPPVAVDELLAGAALRAQPAAGDRGVGVALDLDALTIAYGDEVVSRGAVEVDHDRAVVTAHMAGRFLTVTCHLGAGSASWFLLTNDLTHAYVDENMGTS